MSFTWQVTRSDVSRAILHINKGIYICTSVRQVILTFILGGPISSKSLLHMRVDEGGGSRTLTIKISFETCRLNGTLSCVLHTPVDVEQPGHAQSCNVDTHTWLYNLNVSTIVHEFYLLCMWLFRCLLVQSSFLAPVVVWPAEACLMKEKHDVEIWHHNYNPYPLTLWVSAVSCMLLGSCIWPRHRGAKRDYMIVSGWVQQSSDDEQHHLLSWFTALVSCLKRQVNSK